MTRDEWDNMEEPIKRAGFVKRTFNKLKGKARKIKKSVHFFVEKLRLSEKEYLAIKNDSNMWIRVSDAFVCRVDNEDVEAKDSYGIVLLRFTKSSTYCLTIDTNKIKKAFFKDDVPVKISVTESDEQEVKND